VVPPVEKTTPPAPAEEQPPVGEPEAPTEELEVEAPPEDTIRDLTSLAETLGAEPDLVLESIMVPNAIGIDVPLGEALQTWRRNEETFDARRQELESTYQGRIANATQQTEKAVATLTGLAKVLIEELSSDFQNVDFDALRHTNPDEYLRLSEAKIRRRQRMEEVFKAVEGTGVLRQQMSAEKLAAQQRDEAMKLIRKRPDWVKKPEIMQTIVKENQDVMRHLGFSEAEINSVTDHRFIIGLHYAAQHLKTLQGVQGKRVEDAKRRQLLRPQALRSGPRQTPQAPNTELRQTRMQQFSQARDVRSAAALIETMLPPQR
jgi:hypothetical protein